MLGGDKRLIDAHNQAVDFAVRQVEALASTRVMTDGQSETVLTGNLVMALFNHDTSRDQEPQLHTHAVVANVTQHNGEWKTLSSDKVGKTGFIENVYANQIAFGRLYREKLKEQVEALGYEPKWWVSTVCGRCRAYRWRPFPDAHRLSGRPSGKTPR